MDLEKIPAGAHFSDVLGLPPVHDTFRLAGPIPEVVMPPPPPPPKTKFQQMRLNHDYLDRLLHGEDLEMEEDEDFDER